MILPCPCILRGQHLSGYLSPETSDPQFLSHSPQYPSLTKATTGVA